MTTQDNLLKEYAATNGCVSAGELDPYWFSANTRKTYSLWDTNPVTLKLVLVIEVLTFKKPTKLRSRFSTM